MTKIHSITAYIITFAALWYSSQALAQDAKSYFIDREGQKMSLPVKFMPSQKLLEKHRELLVG